MWVKNVKKLSAILLKTIYLCCHFLYLKENKTNRKKSSHSSSQSGLHLWFQTVCKHGTTANQFSQLQSQDRASSGPLLQKLLQLSPAVTFAGVWFTSSQQADPSLCQIFSLFGILQLLLPHVNLELQISQWLEVIWSLLFCSPHILWSIHSICTLPPIATVAHLECHRAAGLEIGLGTCWALR